MDQLELLDKQRAFTVSSFVTLAIPSSKYLF